MNIKRYRIFLLILCFIVVFSALIICFTHFSMNKTNNYNYENKYNYILKEYNDKIGVYRVGEDKPFEVIDTYTERLTATDKELIKTGIYVENDEKLFSLIEDFES